MRHHVRVSTQQIEVNGPTVRVRQLAAAKHVPVPQLVEELRYAGLSVRGGSDRLTQQQAAAALKGFEAALDPALARPLIIEAFETARDTEHDNWRQMTHAVLKNRLLDATKRGFSEVDYGAPTFAYFVSLFPDLLKLRMTETGPVLVEIDASAVPERITPTSTSTPTLTSSAAPRRERIREDLWDAFADYASGEVYVWDEETRLATVGEPTEGRIQIPTLTPAEEAGWRAEFEAGVSTEMPDTERAALQDWRRRRLPSGFLPPRLRAMWNRILRTRMMEKIQAFFDENGLSAPVELLAAPGHQHHGAPTPAVQPRDDVRALLQRCIALMSEDQLRALPVPVDVVLRASKQ